jgi:hypothetical protein
MSHTTHGQAIPPGAPEIITAPFGGTREAGASSTLTVGAAGNATLTYQWFRGTASIPIADISGATSSSYTIANPTTAHTSYYGVRVTNSLGSASSVPVLVTYEKRAGSLASTSPAAGDLINALLPLPDGSIVCGGAFKTLTPTGGFTTDAFRLARILSNNTLESNTTFPFVNGNVGALHRDSSGRIIVAGDSNGFTYAFNNSVPTERRRLARFLPDGSLDHGFLSPFSTSGQIIHAIASGTDGRVYLGGSFTSVAGSLPGSGQYLMRLDATTGAIDSSFIPEPGIINVRALHLRDDGKLLVGHNAGVWLLNDNGSRDTGFAGSVNGALAFSPLANGDVIVASLTTLYKLNSAGDTLSGFPASPINYGPSSSMLLQPLPNGDVCVSGDFNTYNGAPAGRIAFINADGSSDNSYAIGAGFNMSVNAMALDTLGRLHLGGSFTSYKGATSTRYAVLNTVTTTPTDPGAPVTGDSLAGFLTDAGVPANLRGPNDDADNDGLDNLLEYALDLNPNGNGGAFTGNPTTSVRTPTQLNFTYRRVRNDVTYIVQTSPDPANSGAWTAIGVTQGTPGPDGTTTASIPLSSGSQFLRLSVTR